MTALNALAREELEKSKEFAQKVVERYDGDDDFGCTITNNKDCYTVGDNLYPSIEIITAIKKEPIHNWQIENEFLYQMHDCTTPAKGRVTKEQMVNHIKEMSKFMNETLEYELN